TIGCIIRIVAPFRVDRSRILAVMLQGHLEKNSRLLRRAHDGIPFLGDSQIKCAEIPTWSGPVQVFSIPIVHPDARPILTRRAQTRQDADDVGCRINVPGDVLPDGKIAATIAGDEPVGIRRIDGDKTRAARVTSHSPGSGLQITDADWLAIEFYTGDLI